MVAIESSQIRDPSMLCVVLLSVTLIFALQQTLEKEGAAMITLARDAVVEGASAAVLDSHRQY